MLELDEYKEGDILTFSTDEIRRKVTPIAKKYELQAVYLFGSYARNEATDTSDVDLLVDIKDSLVKGWIIGGLYNDLCDAFGEKTDLVTVGALTQDERTPWFTENVMQERMLLYERE